MRGGDRERNGASTWVELPRARSERGDALNWVFPIVVLNLAITPSTLTPTHLQIPSRERFKQALSTNQLHFLVKKKKNDKFFTLLTCPSPSPHEAAFHSPKTQSLQTHSELLVRSAFAPQAPKCATGGR